jgi:5S rRNA maturation endonuclease (ribonuclease M5)
MMACPIHGGDNDGACVIFKDGESMCGNWVCFTHACQQEHGISIIGFISGALEAKHGRRYNKHEVTQYIRNICKDKKLSVSTLDFSKESEFSGFANYFVKREAAKPIPKQKLTSSLKIPSQYYVRRGYTKEILIKYSVGFCNTKGKPFYLRTVVPVFDDDTNMVVGVTGRTINSECPKCGWFHYVNHKCPQTRMEKYFASKWINSKGFYKTNYLYNTWYAKPHIQESRTAILVEGAGDIWRMEECGIHNGLGMFGCSLNDKQIAILRNIGAENLVVVLDNDDAGIKGKEKIQKKCGHLFNLEFLTTRQKDIGDSSCDEVMELFGGIQCQMC